MGLHQRYEVILQGYKPQISLSKDEQDQIRTRLTEAFSGLMSALFRQKGATLDINILASDEAQHFISTHADILDKAFQKVEMTEAMRRRLTRSDYIFSGLKTFHELNEAFPSLLDENGNRKSFEQFYNDVQKIDKTYNQNYLHAEYNFVRANGGKMGTIHRGWRPLQPAVPHRRRRQGQTGARRTQRSNTTHERPFLGNVLPAKRMELPVYRRAGQEVKISAHAYRRPSNDAETAT